MRERLRWAVTAAVTAVSLLAATGASAATEVGNDCVASNAQEDLSFLQIAKAPGSALPVAAPAAGVVTRWNVSVIPFPGTLPQQLKVFRATGNPSEFQAVAQSVSAPVVSGSNSFDTRIPVQAGDRFGLFGTNPEGTLYCQTGDLADEMGFAKGDVPVGSAQLFATAKEAQVAVSALIEPDADGDGFGDETQDRCPRSAAVQIECPAIALGSYGIARRGSALLLVATSSPTAVTVSSTVGIPKTTARKKRKRAARASALVSLDGGTQVVAPGQLAQFTLRFTKRLKKTLAQLPRKRSLTLRIAAVATDLAGRPSSTTARVKLRGQEKPQKKRRGTRTKAKG